MERRFLSFAGCPVRLEQRGTDPPMIAGLGSVFYSDSDPGSEYELWADGDMRCVERIMPTAFDRCMREARDVTGLFNHDPNCLLGRTSNGTLKLEKTTAGLRYAITCNPADPDHQRVMAKLQRGDVKGSSFSFMPSASGERWIRQGGLAVREIHDCDVYDVGPVTNPAYAATTAGMRAAGGVEEARAALARWEEQQKRLAAAKAYRDKIDAIAERCRRGA